MDSNEDLPWYAWLAIGAGVLLVLVVVYLCYKLRCCCWSQPKEETAPRRRPWHTGRDNVSGDGPASLEAGIGYGSPLGPEPVAVSSRSKGGSQSPAVAAPKIGFWHEAENDITRGAYVNPAITSDHVDKPTIRTVSGYVDNAATSGRVNNTSPFGYVNNTTPSGYVSNATTSGYVNRISTSGYLNNTTISGNVNKNMTSGYVNNTTSYVNTFLDSEDDTSSDEYEYNASDVARFKELDLHGYRTAEAVDLVEEHLHEVPDGFGSVHIITGRGLHSKDGIPRIRPAVENLLNAHDLKYQRRSKGGMLRVVV